MSEGTTASIAGVDGERLVDRLRERTDGTLFAVAEYDVDDVELLYVDEATRAFYRNDEEMYDHFETIHSYVHVDFVEMGLFTDELFPLADDVDYVVTAMDFLKLVRVYHGDVGIFLSVDPDESVVPLVEVVREAFGES